MILQSLVAMAQRENLVEDPSYQSGEVSFAIVLAPDGRFLQLMDLRVESGKRKVGKKMPIPKRTGRTVNDQEDFLVDKAEYVLGVEPDGKRSNEKLALRLGLFRAAVERAAAATQRPELRAVGAFLDVPEARQRCIGEAESLGYKSNHLFCFEVGGRFVQDLPEVKRYWAAGTAAENRQSGRKQCLVCGEEGEPVDKHPQIKVAGGSTSGVSLVSFNKGAFEKHGWEGQENAPFCEKCANAYATALRRSLDPRYPDPGDPERTLVRQSAVLSENLTAVYWMDQPNTSILERIETATGLRAEFDAPWKGSPAGSVEGNFYCLFLQGGQGRAALRDWHTQAANLVERNLEAWFAQTEVDGRTRSILALRNGLAVNREGYKLPERVVRTLFLAAVFGWELPLSLLAAAVERNKAEHEVAAERAALLQGYFARKGRKGLMELDLKNTTPAYRLGRLLAVLQQQQYRFNRSLNKNITDRFFTSLSTRPASVFPAMMALARTHTAALKGEGGYFERRIAELLSEVYPIPPRFDLEEQGEFALGYYHERQNYFEEAAKNREAREAVEEGEDTDAA